MVEEKKKLVYILSRGRTIYSTKRLYDEALEFGYDVKVIDSTIAIGSVKIKSTKYNLYPEKDVITNDGVSTSVINKDATFVFNLSDNIKTAKTEDIVGTYTAKYNGKEFTGNLVLR